VSFDRSLKPGDNVRAALERLRKRGLTEVDAYAVAEEAGLTPGTGGHLLGRADVPVLRSERRTTPGGRRRSVLVWSLDPRRPLGKLMVAITPPYAPLGLPPRLLPPEEA
jgi:hypothetical protein